MRQAFVPIWARKRTRRLRRRKALLEFLTKGNAGVFLESVLPDIPDYVGKFAAAFTIRAMSGIIFLQTFVLLLNASGVVSNAHTESILFIAAGMLWVFVFMFLLTWALLYARRT